MSIARLLIFSIYWIPTQIIFGNLMDSIKATKTYHNKKFIKLHEQIFENDFIKFRKFGYPYMSFESDLNQNASITMGFKYNYYNYKNEDYFPTTNYYQYYGLINKKITVEIGLRWKLAYHYQSENGLFLSTIASFALTRSSSDLSNNVTSHKVPSLGLGIGYRYFFTSRISAEIEVIFKKGAKFMYLNNIKYRQADINYNNLGIRLGMAYIWSKTEED